MHLSGCYCFSASGRVDRLTHPRTELVLAEAGNVVSCVRRRPIARTIVGFAKYEFGHATKIGRRGLGAGCGNQPRRRHKVAAERPVPGSPTVRCTSASICGDIASASTITNEWV